MFDMSPYTFHQNKISRQQKKTKQKEIGVVYYKLRLNTRQ